MSYPIERHRDGFYIFIDMILTSNPFLNLIAHSEFPKKSSGI